MAEHIPSTSEWLETHVISGPHSKKKMKLINKSLDIVNFYFSTSCYHPLTGGKVFSSYYF